MQDYMRALHLRFKSVSPQAREMDKEREVLRRKLAARLEMTERRMLLRLVDLENELREHESINAFISGFRLANGIQRELSELPPYSFEAENEKHAREIFEKGD